MEEALSRDRHVKAVGEGGTFLVVTPAAFQEGNVQG